MDFFFPRVGVIVVCHLKAESHKRNNYPPAHVTGALGRCSVSIEWGIYHNRTSNLQRRTAWAFPALHGTLTVADRETNRGQMLKLASAHI